MWVALCGWPMILHLLISHFYPLQCDIISLTNLKITQAIRLLISFCKHGILLGLQYFKFLFIYERILNRIIIQIFGTFILSLVFAETVTYGTGFAKNLPCTQNLRSILGHYLVIVSFSSRNFNFSNARGRALPLSHYAFVLYKTRNLYVFQ